MKKRLFVVDDDSSVREALKKVLEDTGYEVVVAPDGRKAEASLDDPRIDLLILDMNMPNGDGWDVLEDTSSKHPLLPVIVITGMADQLATYVLPGVSALLKKPIEVPTLLEKIEELLAESVEQRLRRITGCGEPDAWLRAGNGGHVEPALKRPVTVSRRTHRSGK